MPILLGTPVYEDQVLVPYHTSIISLLQYFAGRQAFQISIVSSTIVSRARNAMATRVLNDKALSHLLFIDSDMGFSPQLIEKMLAFSEPVVGAICPKRQPIKGPANFVNAGDIIRDDGQPRKRGSFVQMTQVGTGITLIRRDALERMRESFPDLWSDDPRGEYGYFGIKGGVFQPFEAMKSEEGIFTSEDIAFARRWATLGEIWACYDETIVHAGRERFRGRYADFMPT